MSEPETEEEKNYLRIQSSAFSLELEGDPNFILDTYDSVRQDILKRLIELMRAGQAAPLAQAKTDPQGFATLPNKAVDGPSLQELAERAERGELSGWNTKAAKKPGPRYTWVYVTHEIYNKVYVVDSDTFQSSPLSDFLDGRRIRKLFVDREFKHVLGPMMSTGKTLWSELTAKGREKLGGGSG